MKGRPMRGGAVGRIVAARRTLGVFAIVVEAKDATAEKFYRRYGFRPCGEQGLQLYLPLGME